MSAADGRSFGSLVLAALTAGCAPALLADDPGAGVDPGSPVAVACDPACSLAAAPPVLRLRVRPTAPAQTEIDPGRVLLFAGELSSGQLGQIERGELSETLAARVLPAFGWRFGTEATLAPTEVLALGGRYTLAGGSPPFAVPVAVAAADTLPVLRLRWPPGGLSPRGTVGVWCGEAPLPPGAWPAALDPNAIGATLVRGIALGDEGARCVRLEPAGDPAAWGPSRLGPVTLGEPAFARLEPRPLSGGGAEPAALEPVACAASEVPLGPGCALVLDDRVRLTTPATPLLWSVVATWPGGRGEWLTESEGGDRLLSPLPPSTTVTLVVTVIDSAGHALGTSVPVHTLAPSPHLVLSEALANPLGPEPEQEWVELYNDGLAWAELGGYRLGDVGGETVLPGAAIPPAGYALLVNDDYDPALDYDPQPPPGALVIRVPKLGTAGLNNDGERLRLFDSDGALVSELPAKPKPKPGRSLYRRDSSADDDDPDAFALSEEGASTPAAPNPP